MKFALLACFGILPILVQSPVIAAPGHNIAIQDFKPNNAPAGDAATVSGFVRSAFVRAGAYSVVDKANMDRILSEQAFQQTGCTDQNCAVKLGKLLNVQKMVVGEYSVMGGVRFLTASLVDVETGKIEGVGKVKGFELGNADEAAEDLARQLGGGVPPAVDARTQVQAEETRRQAAADAARKTADAAEAAKEAEQERLEAEREAAEDSDPRVARGRIGVGLNYPGLGLRLLIGTRWMVEARGQYEKEAQAYGGRAYLYVFPSGRIYPYLGLEGDYVRYTGEGLKASGPAGEAFAGLEYFILRNISLQFDGGVAYARLGQTGVWVDGIRFAVNFGLTYSF